MKLAIKNMVCNRCIMVVENELAKLNLHIKHISLGQVEIEETLDREQSAQLAESFSALGFELIDDKRTVLIEQVKHLVLDLIRNQHNNTNLNLSEIISNQIYHDYNYISNLFSDVEGMTIEKYFISQKIEYVKELLVYDELTLSEIAYQLNYSSVAYLSNQFKKVTGLTPSHFKHIKENKRKPLDKIHDAG
ncbi:AraC family transcriptional regulator [Sphingobacterium puteale]|uniref:AraC family transcriptional regulator n=1 Tax=Sphingobacterium puteale TaxID=2420510 RepID=A0A420W2M1_9SPHI|nr:AraC family transcriptional regulator [Sphingobacterium puteale]RKO72822.1 AraC family transcriptional regulator [Sphingobacterium puteale]